MKTILQFVKGSSIFIFLTFFTQVGGMIYLIYLPISNRIKQRQWSKRKVLAARLGIFIGLFVLSSFVITPLVARAFGRVPMPIFKNADCPIRPANLLTCFFNRHYVKPSLLKIVEEVAQEINKGKKEPIEIIYLDANFPFIDGFPLLPHKSHDDGEKLDIAFLFTNQEGQRVNKRMSFTGYGACIISQKGETNMPQKCAEKGYFQYSLLKKITSQSTIQQYEFDLKTNRTLLKLFAQHPRIGKIFIEPHLKERLKLSGYKKIRFHGCGAVRHDDHIHVQL